MVTVFFALTALVGLGGCTTMAPEYARPQTPVPLAWPSGPAYAAEVDGQAPTDLAWQEFFRDPKMKQLIALALEHNRDLRVAVLNIERTRALYRIERAQLTPKIDAAAAASAQRLPESLAAPGQERTLEQYSVGLGLSSYELDLFGRIRSMSDQALARYLADKEAARSVRLSLIAEVAATSLNLAANRELLHLAAETLSNQEAACRLIERRLALGAASELDLRRAQMGREAARADHARLRALTAQDENALALLLGTQPPADFLPKSLAELPAELAKIAPGLSSARLLERPDVLEAEKLLVGMHANIGAARAAFFPRISLTGSIGLGSDELSSLFASGSGAWIFAPRIEVPIFDGGSLRAKLATAKIDRDIALARYEKVIQAAFREVADALALRGTIDQQLAARQALNEASAAQLRLTTARYEKGIDSSLAVLEAERASYSARQGLIGVRLARLQNGVSLYKALGGGAGH